MVRYIHLNPVRAHLVPSVQALARYPWSGHAVLMGERTYPAQDAAMVLDCFSRTPRRPRRAYRDFIAAGLSAEVPTDLDGGGLRRSAGGWQRLAPLRSGRERWRFDERVLGSSAFVEHVLATAPPPLPGAHRPDAHLIVEQLCQRAALRCRVAAAEIRSRSLRRPAVAARALVCHLGVTQYGLSLTATAAALSVSKQSVLRGVRAGERVLAATGYSVSELLPR